MPLFKITGNSVKKINPRQLDLERTLHRLFEENLEEILNIDFLANEYATSFGGRIDTLGIDKNGAPCIIEYKRNRNDNVINQGLSYLKWLLDHKANFEALCSEKKINTKIDWDSPRVICIAESYNKFDIDTADLLPINVELMRYSSYDDNILYVESEKYQKVSVPTSGIVNRARQGQAIQQSLQKNYSVEYHLGKVSKNTVEVFQALREKILSLDQNIKEEPKAKYIAYKLSTNFVDITLLQNVVLVYLNVKSGKLKDQHKLARDLVKPKKIGHWGNGDYDIRVTKDTPLDKVLDLIKQSYNLYK